MRLWYSPRQVPYGAWSIHFEASGAHWFAFLNLYVWSWRHWHVSRGGLLRRQRRTRP